MRNKHFQIFFVSLLLLFLELALIRWIGTEVGLFAYLQNIVLVVCFIGFGLGCATSQQEVSLKSLLYPLLTIVALLSFSALTRKLNIISSLLSAVEDPVGWYEYSTVSHLESVFAVGIGVVLIGSLLWVVLWTFVPLGRLLSQTFENIPSALIGYTVNLAGSLLGILLFVSLASQSSTPWIWVVCLVLLILCVFSKKQFTKANLICLVAMIGIAYLGRCESLSEVGMIDEIWSPYQKLNLLETSKIQDSAPYYRYWLKVNGTGYQAMSDLSSENTKTADYPEGIRAGYTQYDLPFLFHSGSRRVLILGAGGGNDAAGALRAGAEKITAVEIDPVIISLGKKFHPEQPYTSSRIVVVNDDARSFLENSKDSFDLISFGLLDSHTMTAMTNARLDHYVYTREAITKARALLAPDGVLVLTFEAHKAFIADRMALVLKEVFAEDPLVFRIPWTEMGFGGVMFVAGNQTKILQSLAENPTLKNFVTNLQEKYPLDLPHITKVATDDWPYIYLAKPKIPTLFFIFGFLLIGLIFAAAKRLKLSLLESVLRSSNLEFLFLGAAFMLLETSNVTRASIVFGMTWQVNAVVISGVLLMCMAANVLAMRCKCLQGSLVYVGLLAVVIVLYFLDWGRYAGYPFISKVAIITILGSAPFLFSGLAFSSAFARCTSRSGALASNAAGAVIGGVLQSLSFLTGNQFLLIIVFIFYTLAGISALKFNPR